MKKLFKCLSLVFVLMLAAVTLVACGDKKDDKEPKETLAKVANATELELALQNGGDIQLTEDIAVENKSFAITKDVNLDLNGKNITSVVTGENANNLFNILEAKMTVNATAGGHVTLNGKTENADNGYVFNVGSAKAKKSGSLVVNAGQYSVKNDVSVIQVSLGSAVINDGIFDVSYDTGSPNATSGSKYLLNLLDKNATNYPVAQYPATTFNYSKDVTIVVNGGYFKDYNPAEAKSEAPTANFLGEHKKSALATGESGYESYYKVEDATQNVSSYAELQTAIEKGGYVVVNQDIVCDDRIKVEKEVELNLNGHKLSLVREENLQDVSKPLLQVNANGKLTIEGNGSIEATHEYAIGVNGGEVTILNGSFKAIESATLLHVWSGKAYIKGGNFENEITNDTDEYGAKFLINEQDTNKNQCTIEITGGSFKGFDPKNPQTNDDATYVKTGYTSEKVDANSDWFVVKPNPVNE